MVRMDSARTSGRADLRSSGFADQRTADERTVVLTHPTAPHSVRDVHMKHQPGESGANVVGRGVADGYLPDEEIARIAREGLARLPVDGRRVLVLIPDGTRTMPMPLMFETARARARAARRARSTSWSRSARTRR